MTAHACVVRHRPYPPDQRMENQIQALLEAGYEVDVFCMGQPGQARREVVNGANVYRVATLERRRAGRLGGARAPSGALARVSMAKVRMGLLLATSTRRPVRAISSGSAGVDPSGSSSKAAAGTVFSSQARTAPPGSGGRKRESGRSLSTRPGM